MNAPERMVKELGDGETSSITTTTEIGLFLSGTPRRLYWTILGADHPGETVRVLQEGEIRTYGEYRTRRLVLEAWDELERQ